MRIYIIGQSAVELRPGKIDVCKLVNPDTELPFGGISGVLGSVSHRTRGVGGVGQQHGRGVHIR